jgi:hypothetical protein
MRFTASWRAMTVCGELSELKRRVAGRKARVPKKKCCPVIISAHDLLLAKNLRPLEQKGRVSEPRRVNLGRRKKGSICCVPLIANVRCRQCEHLLFNGQELKRRLTFRMVESSK